jgi:hypothetical protein
MKTYKPIVAGILGTLASFYMIIPLTFVLFFGGGMYQTDWKVTVFTVLAVVSLIMGIFGIVSYGFAFGRKRWKLTLTGSSSVLFLSVFITVLDGMVLSAGLGNGLDILFNFIPALLSIPSLVLIILSKNEFGLDTKSD